MARKSDPYQIWKLLSLLYKIPLEFHQNNVGISVDLTYKLQNCRMLRISEDDFIITEIRSENSWNSSYIKDLQSERQASITEDHLLHKIEITLKPSSAETQFLRETAQYCIKMKKML